MQRISIARTVMVLVAVLTPDVVQAVDPGTLATRGQGAVIACASCHGARGEGQASFPRLAGMDAGYLLKQLQDFADGRRSNAIMQPIAKAMSPVDRKAMADHYAAMPLPVASTGTPRPSDGGELGAWVATRGVWAKDVPACVQCHGPGGVGVGSSFPAIAAQPAGYISAQLRAWRDGTRKNDPLDLMAHVSQRLSDAEISAVSAWFSVQPAVVPASGPSVFSASSTPTTSPAAPRAATAQARSDGAAGAARVLPPPRAGRAGGERNGRRLAFTCSGCHGIAGYRNAYPNYHVPRIAGQSAAYLVNALNGYRSGARSHPTMQAQAESLSDQDIADIASYLSAADGEEQAR